jgi:hypothetical protein
MNKDNNSDLLVAWSVQTEEIRITDQVGTDCEKHLVRNIWARSLRGRKALSRRGTVRIAGVLRLRAFHPSREAAGDPGFHLAQDDGFVVAGGVQAPIAQAAGSTFMVLTSTRTPPGAL